MAPGTSHGGCFEDAAKGQNNTVNVTNGQHLDLADKFFLQTVANNCSLVGAIQVPTVGAVTATSATLNVAGVPAGSYNVIAQFNTGSYCGNDVVVLP